MDTSLTGVPDGCFKTESSSTRTGHPLGWLLTVLQKENASEAEIKSPLIEAISHLNTLGEDQIEQWEIAIAYLLLLILHRRPDEQHDDLQTVVQDQIPLLRRKDAEKYFNGRGTLGKYHQNLRWTISLLSKGQVL